MDLPRLVLPGGERLLDTVWIHQATGPQYPEEVVERLFGVTHGQGCRLRRGDRYRTAMRSVLLYSRSGCHLCEEAEDLLAHHAPDAVVIFVGSDDALVRRYGLRVPVLVIDGREVAEGRFTEEELIRALDAAGS
ncbi:MAG: glutaredoxin family protein [Planctomycetota bacterium]|nr:MAG: glutaredoxin family protein [Planctomycetota bacterium]